MISVVALVALRLGVGAHFYMEGVDKIRDPKPFSAGFLSAATGPLGPLFQGMVWDGDGRARLNYEEGPDGRPRVNLDITLNVWAQYRERVIDHYGFAEDQKREANRVYEAYARQWEWFVRENKDDIETYFKGLKRREQARQDPAPREVGSLRGQMEVWLGEMYAERSPWLAMVDTMWRGYEQDLNNLATPEQKQRGQRRLSKPGRKLLDSVFMDKVVPWFDLTVGVLLIAGLFTRVASLAGAGFLCTIIATQMPGAPDAASTIYQIIEVLSMLVLAAVGAGRFAGLDCILRYARVRCRPRKKGANDESDA